MWMNWLMYLGGTTRLYLIKTVVINQIMSISMPEWKISTFIMHIFYSIMYPTARQWCFWKPLETNISGTSIWNIDEWHRFNNVAEHVSIHKTLIRSKSCGDQKTKFHMHDQGCQKSPLSFDSNARKETNICINNIWNDVGTGNKGLKLTISPDVLEWCRKVLQ